MLNWLGGSVASLLLFSYAASWLVHWIKRYRGDKSEFFGPADFWIEILTHFPLLVLALGIAVPAAFGFYGLEQCGFLPTINMVFSTYLAVDLPTQVTYNCVQDSLEGLCWGRTKRCCVASTWNFLVATEQPNSS
ncbi:unnamed protein product [Durusdinium trenchii]|uniref:Uncharacterized protein n=1 Tax=Durusdinium trenchii TaxID=1381693 RepID=A0ABP0Q3U8_9DINO